MKITAPLIFRYCTGERKRTYGEKDHGKKCQCRRIFHLLHPEFSGAKGNGKIGLHFFNPKKSGIFVPKKWGLHPHFFTQCTGTGTFRRNFEISPEGGILNSRTGDLTHREGKKKREVKALRQSLPLQIMNYCISINHEDRDH